MIPSTEIDVFGAVQRVKEIVSDAEVDGESGEVRKILERVGTDEAHKGSVDTTAAFRAEVADKLRAYQELTEALGQANEAYAANSYIHGLQNTESSRLDRYNKAARSEVYKSQQMQVGMEHETWYYSSIRYVMLLTLLATCLLFLTFTAWMDGMWTWLYVLSVAVVLVTYTRSVYGVLAMLNRRRPNVSGGRYWGQSHLHEKESCKTVAK
jgi:hypothetical protein